MFADESFLAILFRLVNFGILAWLCAYAFRRYVLPMLQDQMQQEEKELASIKAKHSEAKKQLDHVVRFAQEQEALCIVLKERVVQWRRAEDVLLTKRIQEKERRIRYLQDKVALQEQEYMRQVAMRITAPQAIEAARAELQKNFSNQKNVHAYTGDIIAAMHKELS